jgi:hypothetical protein
MPASRAADSRIVLTRPEVAIVFSDSYAWYRPCFVESNRIRVGRILAGNHPSLAVNRVARSGGGTNNSLEALATNKYGQVTCDKKLDPALDLRGVRREPVKTRG